MTPISQGLRGVYLDVSWIFLELVLCHLATICSDALFFRNIKFPPDNLASVKECKWFATRFVLPYLSTQTTMSAVVLSTEQAPYYKCTASLHKSLLPGWIHSITRFPPHTNQTVCYSLGIGISLNVSFMLRMSANLIPL